MAHLRAAAPIVGLRKNGKPKKPERRLVQDFAALSVNDEDDEDDGEDDGQV